MCAATTSPSSINRLWKSLDLTIRDWRVLLLQISSLRHWKTLAPRFALLMTRACSLERIDALEIDYRTWKPVFLFRLMLRPNPRRKESLTLVQILSVARRGPSYLAACCLTFPLLPGWKPSPLLSWKPSPLFGPENTIWPNKLPFPCHGSTKLRMTWCLASFLHWKHFATQTCFLQISGSAMSLSQGRSRKMCRPGDPFESHQHQHRTGLPERCFTCSVQRLWQEPQCRQRLYGISICTLRSTIFLGGPVICNASSEYYLASRSQGGEWRDKYQPEDFYEPHHAKAVHS